MKKQKIGYKKGLILLMCIILFTCSLIGCDKPAAETSKTSTQSISLPTTISQDKWADSKKEITLSTGIKMKYVEMGQADGPIIIFLHGMTDNSRSWSLIEPYFTSKYHIYMLDQRGHGATDKPDLRMYPISLYASDLAAFMDQLGIKNANIIGHSMGSMIAQAFAINYPEKVDHLVLESSTLVNNQTIGLDMYNATLSFGDNPPSEEFMDNWYCNPNPVDKEFLSHEKAEASAIPPYAWRAITKGVAFSDLTPFMSEIKAPTLILWGTSDTFFGKKNQDDLHKALPNAKFISYENIGHNIHWEDPQSMATDVLSFLETSTN